MREQGYDEEMIARVGSLIQKKRLKKDEDVQTLEDVVCLVFLEHYFDAFSQKHDKDKLIDILKKTWVKMSPEGHKAAFSLPLSASSLALIEEALA